MNDSTSNLQITEQFTKLNVLPKYCSTCGRELIKEIKLNHYDENTGEPIYHTILKCSVNKIMRVLQIHTHNEYDSNGDKIIEYYQY